MLNSLKFLLKQTELKEAKSSQGGSTPCNIQPSVNIQSKQAHPKDCDFFSKCSAIKTLRHFVFAILPFFFFLIYVYKFFTGHANNFTVDLHTSNVFKAIFHVRHHL